MSSLVDAKGLSCPQPVLMTLDRIKSGETGEITVLVDTDTSKENVARAAENNGWRTKDIQPEGKGYRIVLSKD